MSTDKNTQQRKIIEFYIRHAWNIHRVFLQKILTPRCANCAISKHLQILRTDGVCTACFEKQEVHTDSLSGEEQKNLETSLMHIITESEEKGKWKYDALVFFSGGKDSTYLLYQLRQRHSKLRILAITVDNDFMSTTALQNVTEDISKINVDHVIVRPNARMYEKLFRYAFTHLGDTGHASAIDVLDGELRFDIGRHYATMLGIPLIIIGFSREQVQTYIGNLTIESERAKESQRRTHLGIFPVDELPFSDEERRLVWDGSQYPDEQIARIIYPLVAWHYDEEFIKSEVVRLGLMKKQNVSPLMTNHQLIPLMAVTDFARLGYSSWEPEFSRMIREGKADRIYWRNLFELIEYASKTGIFVNAMISHALTRLNLKQSDVGLPGKK